MSWYGAACVDTANHGQDLRTRRRKKEFAAFELEVARVCRWDEIVMKTKSDIYCFSSTKKRVVNTRRSRLPFMVYPRQQIKRREDNDTSWRRWGGRRGRKTASINEMRVSLSCSSSSQEQGGARFNLLDLLCLLDPSDSVMERGGHMRDIPLYWHHRSRRCHFLFPSAPSFFLHSFSLPFLSLLSVFQSCCCSSSAHTLIHTNTPWLSVMGFRTNDSHFDCNFIRWPCCQSQHHAQVTFG